MSFLKPSSATSAPSPTPSNSSQTGKKRPRPDPSAPVYSQPENTSSGLETMTRVTFALDYLKENDKAMTFEDVFKYLSIQEPGGPGAKPRPAPKGGRDWKLLTTILQRHDKVEFDPTGFKGLGSYRYRPKHNVRSAEQLKGLLQRQTSSVGIKVSELKDGWTGAIDAINELDKKGEILVTRNQKTGQPLLVWQNDPSLSHNIDPEFRSMFLSIALPANPDDMRSRLEAAGLKPVSAPRESKPLNNQPQKKKKKAPRKGMKTSNTHMLNVFRDYSDKKK
ncbi:putative transcription initiation factor beta protein [Lasiodiplodia theobromae]|uniref:Transcription initiation factor IIE subunit beta n=1 Tax=Lasiodiplodia theobromae TaxID=45133 RepID=A0A5N5DDC7_9PEZI|nr:Transcription initiation factor beta protein [Lasiodiplodia theobromae]KAB2575440.1 Transcription initiation factor IIE subunit beta [Lasiodiplodia theobromae]KAF4536802.1 Transcription initiation factor beta protein [Lasiodiplodia theobromae]KAF9635208.1 putative transcription initiation factor beta protein [Lasiodiplodia theobromae]